MGPPPGYAPLPPPRPVMPPPQPSWGPPPPGGFAPYPVMPPRRKSSNGPILALVLGGVAVLGLAAIGGFFAMLNNKVKDAGYSNYTTYSPTYTYTTTTEATTTTTSSTRTSSSRSTSTSATPVGPKAVYKLADHPIFSAGLGAYDFDSCPLPAMAYDPAGEERFLQAALPCIEKAWQPTFKKANLPYQPVELQVFTGSTQTPCGEHTTQETAMFCRGVIYWPAGYYANEGGSTVATPACTSASWATSTATTSSGCRA